jgi:outer membrane biosynthesis protein TonB
MPNYRLTWNGDGSLDLSAVLDVQGKPILFDKKGAQAVVDENSLKHPVISRYGKAGMLVAEDLSNVVAKQAPTPPAAPAATAPPAPKAAPKPAPPPEEPPPKEEPPKEEPPKEEPPKEDVVTSVKIEAEPDDTAEELDKPKTTTRKPKGKAKRGGK